MKCFRAPFLGSHYVWSMTASNVIDWLVDLWSIDWLIVRLVGLLFGWLIDLSAPIVWLVYWLFNWLIDRSFNGGVDRVIGYDFYWLTDWPITRSTAWQINNNKLVDFVDFFIDWLIRVIGPSCRESVDLLINESIDQWIGRFVDWWANQINQWLGRLIDGCVGYVDWRAGRLVGVCFLFLCTDWSV